MNQKMKRNIRHSAGAISAGAIIAGVLVAGLSMPLMAADLPNATKKILKELKLDASILSGLDKEMKVPKAWVDGARKTGKLRIHSSWSNSEFVAMSAPFRERYPFIKIEYSRPKRNDRAIKPLIALKTGRYITDIVNGLGGKVFLYYKDDLLADLRGLPNTANIPAGMMDKKGRWVGVRLRYWCTAYNTKKIKKADLPKTWGDLLTMSALRKGNLALANRPNQWVVNLWSVKGPKWTTNFLNELFTKVKPQLRKEGTSALVGLLVAGEFNMSISAAPFRVQERQELGAPVGFHCPDPAPVSITESSILKGAPNFDAARLYINWVLSKEGQIAKYSADRATPIHKDLIKLARFRPLGGEGQSGNKVAMRGPKEALMLPDLYKVWGPLWDGHSGIKYTVVTTKILAKKRGGRFLEIKVGGKTHKVTVSGRRTKIKVGGKKASRKKIKVGMTCAINYPGHKGEARTIVCP
ncbi:MAG: ABC transporter substrate-binding protein [Alphaproteobacteria bacterium]